MDFNLFFKSHPVDKIWNLPLQTLNFGSADPPMKLDHWNPFQA
jgi:hypothetical protein